jgi:hypothetical protein
MSQGDIETATIFTRGMRKIQGKFSSILAGGANANFTAMPQVGGDPIVESGSNADGEWTRWSDGTQICTIEKLANSATSFGTGTGIDPYRSSITDYSFPIAFFSTRPVVSSSAYRNITGVKRIVYVAFDSTSTTKIISVQAVAALNDVAPTLMLNAIGRWK